MPNEEKTIDIEVHFVYHLPKDLLNNVLKLAKDNGLDYGDDPGPKEQVRRLLIDIGTDGIELEHPGYNIKITRRN